MGDCVLKGFSMSDINIFPIEEYNKRKLKVVRRLTERGLDACVITTPENIYFLVGLDYQGYFVPHFLILAGNGELYLITRAMERNTIEVQVSNAEWIGYGDGADIAGVVTDTLKRCRLTKGKIGIEKRGLFFPPVLAEKICADLSEAEWVDASGLVDEVRFTQSAAEIAYTRKAARITSKMMEASMEAAVEGVGENEIAAAVYQTMLTAGGDHPGFTPLLRSTPTLEQEHSSWTQRKLQTGDPAFMEMGACKHRYHAPMGRFFYIGKAPDGTEDVARATLESFDSVIEAIKPGAVVKDIYRIWQNTLVEHGFDYYKRHHCGYITGIGFPPSWVGGAMVVVMRDGSDFRLQEGMVLHVMSWMLGTRKGSYFRSDTGLVTADGCEILTNAPCVIEK
jgi:Xaa-Pro dipeptidase